MTFFYAWLSLLLWQHTMQPGRVQCLQRLARGGQIAVERHIPQGASCVSRHTPAAQQVYRPLLLGCRHQGAAQAFLCRIKRRVTGGRPCATEIPVRHTLDPRVTDVAPTTPRLAYTRRALVVFSKHVHNCCAVALQLQVQTQKLSNRKITSRHSQDRGNARLQLSVVANPRNHIHYSAALWRCGQLNQMCWLLGAGLPGSAFALLACNQVFGSGGNSLSARTHHCSMFSKLELEGLQAVQTCTPDLRIFKLRLCR
jgi:hypothetical protein